MIAFVIGEIYAVQQDIVYVNVNGIGYKIFIPANALSKLPPLGEKVFLHTVFYLREDQVQLYGFLDVEDKELFQILIEVSGIGPKLALGILSATSRIDLVNAILNEKISVLTSLPGVGKKTAQRLIYELKDKLEKLNLNGSLLCTNIEPGIGGGEYEEALEALVSLGYNRKEIEQILYKVYNELEKRSSSEELIKIVLKKMSK
ncbi:Holliday junction branch migration protein RuvA [Bacillota bacterium LX-D]|nr:Holliday junction branch migration protein RuvA [Bacillota bacterium LX-D]